MALERFTLGLPRSPRNLPTLEGRTIITADVHATPWVETDFDRFKITLLKKIFEPAENIILAGDFLHRLWYMDQLVDSEFGRTLFPILRARNTIYVLGNHDWKEPKTSEPFWKAFVPQYSYICGEKLITVKHGHQFSNNTIEEFIESPRGKFIRPIHRSLDNFMTHTVVGGWLSFLASRIPNKEHHEIVNQIDNRMHLVVLGHRHTLLNWAHKGLISLGHWGREASWVVTDTARGVRVHHDFVQNYRFKEPNTVAVHPRDVARQ